MIIENIRVDFTRTRSITEDLDELEVSIDNTKHLLNAFQVKKNLTKNLYFFVGSLMLDCCLKNFENLWNIYIVTMDCESLSKFLGLLDGVSSFFEKNDIFFKENKTYIFDKVNKLFFKLIKFDLEQQTQKIVGKNLTADGSLQEPKRSTSRVPSRATSRSVQNLPIDLLFYIDQMLNKYKNSNGQLTRKFLLNLLEHIIDAFQNYLSREKKHEIVKKKLYLHVINNFEIFERKLPSILDKLHVDFDKEEKKGKAILTKSDKDFVYNKERFISNLKLSTKNKFKMDTNSQGKDLEEINEELRVYKNACNRVSIQVFRISNFFFRLLQRSFDQIFSKMFQTKKKATEKEQALLSTVYDVNASSLIENEKYLNLNTEEIFLKMMKTCENSFESISVFFRIRLKKYVFDFFIKNLVKCLLMDLHNFYISDDYDLVDKSFYKLNRDIKQLSKLIQGFDNFKFFTLSLRVMEQLYAIFKAKNHNILDALVGLKSMEPKRIRLQDLILLLKVNPFLRRKEKLRNQIKDQLKEQVSKMNLKFYSIFHKTLGGLIRFIVLLRGKRNYYKKKDEFLTISQVEKTGFKFGLKVKKYKTR